MADTTETPQDTPAPSTGVDGLLYEAWGVIANATDWLLDSDHGAKWQEAAEHWRDRWHAYLDWAHANHT